MRIVVDTSAAVLLLLVIALQDCSVAAFCIIPTYVVTPSGILSTSSSWSTSTTTTTTTITTRTRSGTATVLFAKSRKARRQEEKVGKGRPKQFFKALEDAGTRTPPVNGINNSAASTTATNDTESTITTTSPPDEEETEDEASKVRQSAIAQDAQERYDRRPEVSTMILDEETGTEVLTQGQKVMDIVTRKAVKLVDTPEGRLAQMFPGVPPEIRSLHRFKSWRTVTVPKMLEQLKDACYVTLPNGTKGVPPHPSVASKAIDFVIANRDYLGHRMKKMLGRVTMHYASNNDWDTTKEFKMLWDQYLTLENHISAPFRQIMQDAEGRVGPNFGNLDLPSFCKGELYERIANYLVLKGMVAHWEKKVVDANFYEKNPEPQDNFMRWMAVGDPKRYLVDSPILHTLQECAQVCAKAQEMCQLFVQNVELFADFPPEIVFLEEALKIRGGTALRKYMIDDFCPERGITPEALREGMRRFHQQLDNMQIDPYADLTNKVELLSRAMAIGTDDERDPYEKYLGMEAGTDPNNLGYFETYTFNHPQNSFVRFLDNQYPGRDGFFQMVGPKPTKPEVQETTEKPIIDNPFGFDFGNLFGGKDDVGGDGSGGGADSPFDLNLESILGGAKREKQLRIEPDLKADEAPYDPPEIRAMGRPHELGWLEKLQELDKDIPTFSNMQPGRIIPDDET